ncbi:MAG TPA: peptidoglycan recognition family protein, partial [Armatimonadota bacterium]
MSQLPLASRRQLIMAGVFTTLFSLGALLWVLHVRPASAAAAVALPARGLHIVSAPSPNFTPSSGRAIDTVVIHYTSGIYADPAHWDDPYVSMRIFKQFHVSAHYLIDRQGTVYRLVDERNIAWH